MSAARPPPRATRRPWDSTWRGFDFGLCGAPRPCRGDRGHQRVHPGYITTTTTASTQSLRNRNRTLGVIVYLAQARHSSYGRDSLRLLTTRQPETSSL